MLLFKPDQRESGPKSQFFPTFFMDGHLAFRFCSNTSGCISIVGHWWNNRQSSIAEKCKTRDDKHTDMHTEMFPLNVSTTTPFSTFNQEANCWCAQTWNILKNLLVTATEQLVGKCRDFLWIIYSIACFQIYFQISKTPKIHQGSTHLCILKKKIEKATDMKNSKEFSQITHVITSTNCP